MVYMCVICTVETPPLVALTPKHRNIIEALISSSVDLTPLKRISLLLACSGCMQQLQSLAVFQFTVLKGVRHLLTFLHSWQTQNEREPDPLSLPIKDEPEDSLLSVSSYVPMEIELPMVKPEDIKPEPSLEAEPEDPAPLDIEDNIPLTTVVRPEVFATPHTLTNTQATPVRSDDAKVATFTHGPMKLTPGGSTVSSNPAGQNIQTNTRPYFQTRLEAPTPLGVQANANQSQMPQKSNNSQLRLVNVLPFNFMPVRLSFAPVQNNTVTPPIQLPRLAMQPATKIATFTHGRGGSQVSTCVPSSSEKPVSDSDKPVSDEQPTFSKLLSLLLLNRTDSNTNSAASAKDSVRVTSEGGVVTGTDTDKPEQNEPKSTYYILKLKDSEIKAEREAARSAPEFAEATYKCEFCFIVFKCEIEKEIHDGAVHSSTGMYMCGTCGHAASCLLSLRAHTAQHSVRYCCLHCPFRTPDENVVKEHCCDPKLMKGKRPVIFKGLVQKPRPKVVNPVKCKECHASFADEEKLERHMNRVHSEPFVPVTCKICNREYKNAKAFYLHSQVHKRQQRSVDTINPELFCGECAKQFDSPSAYKAHMLTLKHSGRDHWKFECDICGRRFLNKTRVEIHMQIAHLKLEPYKCEECGRGFNARCLLRRHRAAHAPPSARHVCHVCARAFTVSKSLKEHLLKHEGKRPHACPLCPATFTYSAALYTHNRLKHLKIKGNWKKKAKKKTEKSAN